MVVVWVQRHRWFEEGRWHRGHIPGEDGKGEKPEGKAGKLAVPYIGLLFGSESTCLCSGLPGCLSSALVHYRWVDPGSWDWSPGLVLLGHQTGFGNWWWIGLTEHMIVLSAPHPHPWFSHCSWWECPCLHSAAWWASNCLCPLTLHCGPHRGLTWAYSPIERSSCLISPPSEWGTWLSITWSPI